jgi:hypothetical protein
VVEIFCWQHKKILPSGNALGRKEKAMVIVKRKVREMALQMAKASRNHQFTKVSQTFLENVEWRTRQAISQLVSAHPSKGKTLRGYKS